MGGQFPYGAKEIAFDINQKALKDVYPKKNHRQAYDDIRRTMINNGFIHTQGSVYVSNSAISMYDVAILVRTLAAELPWLSKCVTNIDIAEVRSKLSLKEELKEETDRVNSGRRRSAVVLLTETKE